MPKRNLNEDRSHEISKDALFSIMNGLTVRQRAILSLKYFEGMSLGQMSYVMEMGQLKVLCNILYIRVKLRLLSIRNGCNGIPFKELIAVFGKITSIH